MLFINLLKTTHSGKLIYIFIWCSQGSQSNFLGKKKKKTQKNKQKINQLLETFCDVFHCNTILHHCHAHYLTLMDNSCISINIRAPNSLFHVCFDRSMKVAV